MIEQNVYNNLHELFSYPQYTFMRQKLATAESTTGGMIGSILCNVPGISKYYDGGMIACSKYQKQQNLFVPEEAIDTYNFVSENLARVMAKNSLIRFNVDIALSITGVAGQGPSEGIEEGIAYISVASINNLQSKKLIAKNKTSRLDIRKWFANESLAYLNEFLIEKIEASKNGAMAL